MIPSGGYRGTVLASLLLSAAASASAGSVTLAPAYEDALRRYRSGDREGATAAVGVWPEQSVREQVAVLSALARVAGACVDCPTALMLHTDCARQARRGGGAPRPHEAVAVAIAGLMKDDPPRRSFAGRWFRAMAGLAQGENRWEDALAWAERGLRDFPDSGEMLLLLGSIEETLGAQGVPRVAGGDRTTARERLARARRLLRSALAAQPGLQEARLRLGRVAWRLGDASEARSVLEGLLAGQAHPSTVFLAQLFLGRLHEDGGHLEQAAGSYTAALALEPRSQSAHVALSHVRLRQGDAASAEQEAAAAVGPAGSRLHPDPLWLYPWGAAVRAEEWLAALRREASP